MIFTASTVGAAERDVRFVGDGETLAVVVFFLVSFVPSAFGVECCGA